MINFIQLGANVGNSETDIIWKICRENNWNGIFVEPMLKSFNKLKENYSDLTASYFENIAIMTYDGVCEILFDPLDESEAPNQQASVYKLWGRHNRWPLNTSSISVPCITLTNLIKKYNLIDLQFELLQIDCEGSDKDILLSTNFTNILPKYIRYERVLLSNIEEEEINNHLSQFGYNVIVDQYDIFPGEKNFNTLLERK